MFLCLITFTFIYIVSGVVCAVFNYAFFGLFSVSPGVSQFLNYLIVLLVFVFPEFFVIEVKRLQVWKAKFFSNSFGYLIMVLVVLTAQKEGDWTCLKFLNL